MECTFLFILHMVSKKCFNAQNLFSSIFLDNGKKFRGTYSQTNGYLPPNLGDPFSKR